jgi:hypothetical protein
MSDRDLADEEISGPATTFLSGLGKTQGYSVHADGERMTVAFEPWSLEHEGPFNVPCLRLQFRQEGARVVLERFTIYDEGEERLVDLDAAHDALQAWMDYMAD